MLCQKNLIEKKTTCLTDVQKLYEQQKFDKNALDTDAVLKLQQTINKCVASFDSSQEFSQAIQNQVANEDKALVKDVVEYPDDEAKKKKCQEVYARRLLQSYQGMIIGGGISLITRAPHELVEECKVCFKPNFWSIDTSEMVLYRKALELADAEKSGLGIPLHSHLAWKEGYQASKYLGVINLSLWLLQIFVNSNK